MDRPSYAGPKARELRKSLTPAETQLWQLLRGRGLGGLKFRRQHPFGPYIIDFYCPARRLAIEVDGPHHLTPDERLRDTNRAEYMAAAGIRTLRFTNDDVLQRTDKVVATIETALDPLEPPHD